MRGRILVVEDSEEVREFLVVLLENEGFTVVACEDADQALEEARRERPDLVVTDLMLGATSGLELITRLRSDLAPPIPPIVACSGFTGFEQEALQRGAQVFIPKPFEPSTMQKTVAALLERREVVEAERQEAAHQSRRLRAKVLEAARAALLRLEQFEEVPQRTRASVSFLPRYLGFGEAFGALLHGDRLQVQTASNEESWRIGETVDLGLVRDILESSSPLLVPDLQSLGTVVHGPNGKPLRFFAGVPLLAGSIGVGVHCLVDDQPHRFASDDYSMLHALGRRVSAIASGRESEVGPMWAPSGLLTREGLSVVLTGELQRMERRGLWLSLLVFAGRRPQLEVSPRTAFAELDERRFAVLMTREREEEVREALLDFATERVREHGFDGGGLIRIEGDAAALFEARSIIQAGERLLASARLTAPGTIEQIVFRREAQAILRHP